MTPGARKILDELATDDECDILQEGGIVYCGNRRTTTRVINELLGLLAISVLYKDGFLTPTMNYGINDIGRALRRRPELEIELLRAIYSHPREPFHVVNDRVETLAEGALRERRGSK